MYLDVSCCLGLVSDNWSVKAIRRKTTGTGRMRYLRNVPRRFKTNFREGKCLFIYYMHELYQCVLAEWLIIIFCLFRHSSNPQEQGNGCCILLKFIRVNVIRFCLIFLNSQTIFGSLFKESYFLLRVMSCLRCWRLIIISALFW